MKSSAEISGCSQYRYTLTREWDETLPRTVFVMLNPSTADAHQDDPTIRRCIVFAKTWGSGALSVVNLFALRATDPDAMMAHADPVGPDNDRYISTVCEGDDVARIVLAWGVHGSHRNRDMAVLKLLMGFKRLCLGTTKGGHPRHPLYVKADAPLVTYAQWSVAR